jgi:hypothetical protein
MANKFKRKKEEGIFVVIVTVKFTDFCSEILSNMISIYQDFGWWRMTLYRSQWQRGLRHGSAAACLLVMWVRIPLWHGCLYFVNVVCCQVEVSVTGWSLLQRVLPSVLCVTECDRESSIIRRPWPIGALLHKNIVTPISKLVLRHFE